MSRTWRIEFKDTVPNSNLQELSENDNPPRENNRITS